MNLTAFLAQFRGETQDTVATYQWSDADVTGWFNEAEREAALRGDLLYDDSSAQATQIAITAGDTRVEADPSIYKILGARIDYTTGSTLYQSVRSREWMDIHHPLWATYTGEPNYLIAEQPTLIFAGAATADGTLHLAVHRYPLVAMVAGADEPEIQAIHHDGLYLWVCARAYSRRDPDTYDETKARRYEADFTARYGERPDAQVIRRRSRGGPRTVKMARW